LKEERTRDLISEAVGKIYGVKVTVSPPIYLDIPAALKLA